MKLLVILAVFGLAAAGPVAEPEAQPEADPEADPALVYSTGLTYPYTGGYGISPYTTYSSLPTVYRTGYTYSHVPLTYTRPVIYGRKKRSADPEAQPEADPEADPAVLYSTTGLTYPYIGTPYTYPYATLPTTYTSLPYTTYSRLTYPAGTSYTAVYGRKKRSADPEPQPEADPEADPQILYSAGYTGLPTYPYVSTYAARYPYTYPLTYGVRPVTYSRPLTYAYGK